MNRKLISIIHVLTLITTLINLVFLIEITRNPDLRDFLYFNKELPSNYSNLEKIHMQEVKILFIVSLVVNMGLLFLTKKYYRLINFKLTGYLLLIFSSLVVLFSLISFQSFFTNFHLLIFNSSNWLLPSNSILIQTYPLSYFKNLTLIIFGILVLMAIFMIKFKNIDVIKNI